jgi:PAS domain S-box-containing protein
VVVRTADETRELALLTIVMVVVVTMFAIAGAMMVIETGDLASAVGTAVMVGLVMALIQARRQLMLGRSQRAVVLLVVSVLAWVLVSAPIPPPVPAIAAAPIMAVAFALSFLDGRRLKGALVAAWVVAVITAVVVEFTPASPNLPPALAAALRVGGFAAIVGMVGLVLYRHRARLEQAVTRAQVAGEALRDSEARYRTVVEGVREVIFRIDADGRWSLLNRAWEELTGHPVAESLGRPITDFIHPDDRETHAELARQIANGGWDEYTHELRFVGQDGKDIWVEAHTRPIDKSTGVFSGSPGRSPT